MERILKYLENNMIFVWVFIGVVAAFLIAFFLIKLINKKYREKKPKKENSDSGAEEKEENSSETSKSEETMGEEKTDSDSADKNSLDETAEGEIESADKKSPQASIAKSNAKQKTVAKSKTSKPQENSKTTAIPAEKQEEPVKYAGRWKIKKQGESFIASLYANNGVLMLSSEPYSTLSGAKGGIDTIKRNILSGTFMIKEDKHGYFNFRIISKNKRVVCISESYDTKSACESAMESVKKFAMSSNAIEIEK